MTQRRRFCDWPWAPCFSRTARRRCWAGSAAMVSAEPWLFFTGTEHIPALFAFLAIAAEFLGGLGLIVGLLSRVAALGIAVNMVVAIAMVHQQFGFFMNWSGAQKGEGYEYHVLVIAMAVLVMVRGAGAASCDRALTTAAAAPTS